MTVPTISVVICTRNRSEMIRKVVGLTLANIHPKFEVILVDQSTNDETQQVASSFLCDSRFKYIRSNTVGKGRACNIGLYEARGDVVAYTDDDCIVPPDWLMQLERAFAQDSQIALVFCTVLPGEHDATAGYIPHYIVKENRMLRQIEDLSNGGIGIGAGVAVRKAVFEAIGGFDNNLGPGSRFRSGEDHDIAIRVLLKKYWIYEIKEAPVIHYGFRSWREGRNHSKRDWFACGATYIKPLKCGYPKGSMVLFSMAISHALEPFWKILTFRKPRGFFRIIYFLDGVIAGLKAPVIREKLLYQDKSNIVGGKS